MRDGCCPVPLIIKYPWEDEMLRDRSTLYAALRKYFRQAALAVAPVLLLAGNAAGDELAVRFLTAIPVPTTAAASSTAGALYSFDISWIDQATQLYYLADRSNNVIDVADASNSTFVKQIAANPPFKGFVTPAACAAMVPPGSNCSGPNGVTVSGNFLFATDGGSRVVTIDLTTGNTAGDVVTKANDPNRADELAFDPKDRVLLVINNADNPPFATLINVAANGALSVAKTIPLGFATNGAEQPVWDPAQQRFFLTIPEVSMVSVLGAVIRIHPITGAIEMMVAVPLCSPAGLTLNPTKDELGVGCNVVFDTAGGKWSATDLNTATPYFVIVDAKTGFIEAYVPGGGVGDEVWYNSGDDHYYATLSGGPLAPAPATVQGPATLAVIDASNIMLDQLVPTFNVPAVTTGDPSTQHPAGTAHSVAVNAKNNHAFVPLAANNVYEGCLLGCIAVYGNDAP
jgi:hypothetical protein